MHAAHDSKLAVGTLFPTYIIHSSNVQDVSQAGSGRTGMHMHMLMEGWPLSCSCMDRGVASKPRPRPQASLMEDGTTWTHSRNSQGTGYRAGEWPPNFKIYGFGFYTWWTRPSLECRSLA